MSEHYASKRSHESSLESDNDGDGVPDQKKQRLVDSTESETSATATSTKSTASLPTPAISCQTPTLYVSNLHNRISEPHLQKLFQRFGEINRVHMIRRMGSGGNNSSNNVNVPTNNVYGRGRGKMQQIQQQQQSGYSYAFVEFKSVQSASNAMKRVNGMTLLGKDLVVKPAHSKVGGSDGEETIQSKQTVRKLKTDVDHKIEALKRALREKDNKSKTNP